MGGETDDHSRGAHFDRLEDATVELFDMHLAGTLFSPLEAATRKVELLRTMVRTGIATRRPLFFETMLRETEGLAEKAHSALLLQEISDIVNEAGGMHITGRDMALSSDSGESRLISP